MKAAGRVLNLGCGNNILAYALNVDRMEREGVDFVWDLNDMPWPWEDESFDYVIAKAILEHLIPDLLTSMNEIWRILAPGGIVEIKLPWWNAEVSYDDPTHRWVFGLGIFNRFDPTTKRGKEYSFYTPYKWKVLYPAILNRGRTSFSGRLEVRKGESAWQTAIVGNGHRDNEASCETCSPNEESGDDTGADSRADASLSGDGPISAGSAV